MLQQADGSASMLVLPDHELGAISIMLDLMNPLIAFWWRFNQGRRLEIDELQPVSNGRFGTHGTPRTQYNFSESGYAGAEFKSVPR